MYRENRPRRPSIVSVLSAWSSPSDDGVIVTKHHRPVSEGMPAMLRSRQSSTCSDQSCEAMTPDETRDLWKCMLELQLRYGCYNSTRIDMALDAGDYGIDLMRTCSVHHSRGTFTDFSQPIASSSTPSTSPSSISPTRAASS